MRILAKKHLLLSYAGQTFETVPYAVMDMPDAFCSSLMFRLAEKSGDVTILNAPDTSAKPARRAARRKKEEAASCEQ